MSDVEHLIEVLAEGFAAFEGRPLNVHHRALARHTLGWLLAENYRVIRKDGT